MMVNERGPVPKRLSLDQADSKLSSSSPFHAHVPKIWEAFAATTADVFCPDRTCTGNAIRKEKGVWDSNMLDPSARANSHAFLDFEMVYHTLILLHGSQRSAPKIKTRTMPRGEGCHPLSITIG